MANGKTTADYMTELRTLGTAGYMRQYPEVFQPGYHWYNDPKYGVPTELASEISGYSSQLAGTASQETDLQGQIDDLEQLKVRFPGTEATYIRWLIDNEIRQLGMELERTRSVSRMATAKQMIALGEAQQIAGQQEVTTTIPGAELPYIPPSVTGIKEKIHGKLMELPQYQTTTQTTTPYEDLAAKGAEQIAMGERMLAATQAGASLESYMTEAPVPSWMAPYLEPSMPLTRAEDLPQQPSTEYSKALTLRPLGAQAELLPEQLGQMAGYLAWGKAGSPYMYSERAIQEMADWERWWQPYTTLSKSLFPTQTRLGASWMPAQQRR